MGAILPSTGHLALSGDTVTGGGDGATGSWWGESGDGTEHPAIHKPAPHNQ